MCGAQEEMHAPADLLEGNEKGGRQAFGAVHELPDVMMAP